MLPIISLYSTVSNNEDYAYYKCTLQVIEYMSTSTGAREHLLNSHRHDIYLGTYIHWLLIIISNHAATHLGH